MPRNAHVLIVDDDQAFANVVELVLRQEGFDVDIALDGLAGLRKAYEGQPDLALVDIMMPRMDGWEMCRRLREISQVPIIVISARGREQDIVHALELGADDYLIKPFTPAELTARVHALLRRSAYREAATEKPLAFGDVTIDLKRQRVTKKGNEISLTATEFRLLSALARAPNRVLPHRYLLTEVWGSDYADQVQYLRLYIRYLRQKLEDDPNEPKIILTEWGIGYRLCPPND